MSKIRLASFLGVATPVLLISLAGLSATTAAPLGAQTTDKATARAAPAEDVSTPSTGTPAAGWSLLPALREANAYLMAGRTEDAAHMLSKLDPKTLDEKNARLWRLLSATVAVRHGDAAALQKLNAGQAPAPTADILTITTASWALRGGELDRTEALLRQVRDPDDLSEIPKREYLALWARLGQLRNDPQLETKYISKLVEFTSNWPSATCQTCHANPKKYGDAVTTLDVSDWWVGDRYAALLKQSGQAASVRDAAKKALIADPKDDAAHLRLAFAERALGMPAESEKALREIPWTQFPDREQRDPLRLRVFP